MLQRMLAFSLLLSFFIGAPGIDASQQLLLRNADGAWSIQAVNGTAESAIDRQVAGVSTDKQWTLQEYADLDGNGSADLVLRNAEGAWFVYLMKATSAIASGGLSLTENLDWELRAIKDFDGDGKADVLLRHRVTHTWYLYRMDGMTAIEQGGVRLSANPDWVYQGSADFDGDGRGDVLLRHRVNQSWYQYSLDGLSIRTEHTGLIRFALNPRWQFVSAADFTGDGKADLIMRRDDGPWWMYAVDGLTVLKDSNFGIMKMTANLNWAFQGSGDLGDDGVADILLRNTANDAWFVYALNGREVLSTESGRVELSDTAGWELKGLSAIDSDGDGVQDDFDFYPKDQRCFEASQGNGERCYLTVLALEPADTVFLADNGVSHFFRSGWTSIIRLDDDSNRFLPALSLIEEPGEVVTAVAYSSTLSKLFVGYRDGAIKAFSDGVNTGLPLTTLEHAVDDLHDVGSMLLAITNETSWQRKHILINTNNGTGNEISLDASEVYSWNESKNRLYYFQGLSGRNRLKYSELDKGTLSIIETVSIGGGANYNRSNKAPIAVSPNGESVVLGVGDTFVGEDLAPDGSLAVPIDQAVWPLNNELLIAGQNQGQVLIRRLNKSLDIEEAFSYSGTLVDLAYDTEESRYRVIVNEAGDYKVYTFTPSDDTDGDGVRNIVDAFPDDSAASLDSDNDGYPDSWHSPDAGSVSTLVLDAFPQDSGCFLLEHGVDGVCDPGTTVPKFIPLSAVENEVSGELYLFSPENGRIYIRDMFENRYANPIIFDPAAMGLTPSTAFGDRSGEALIMSYSASQQRIYIGYSSGKIYSIDLNGDRNIQMFATTAEKVRGLVAVGDFLLAQDDSGAWASHYIFDRDGRLTDLEDWNYYSRVYAWNPANSRVYFFGDGFSPNDLRYETIDQVSGEISESGDSPYHGKFSIRPPILISGSGDEVLLGSGDRYHSDELTWNGTINQTFTAARWLNDDQFVTLSTVGDQTQLNRFDNFNKLDGENYTGAALGVYVSPDRKTATVVLNNSGELEFHIYTPNDDSDGDGVDNIDDAYPNDVSASVDSDRDGYPDLWNEGYSQQDSTSGLTLDAFPDDAACYLSEHGSNGVCDYSATVGTFIPALTGYDKTKDIAYLLDTDSRKIQRWSFDTESYLDPYIVAERTGNGLLEPKHMLVSDAHERLYVAYDNGAIYYFDLSSDSSVPQLFTTAVFLTALANTGQNLVVVTYDNSIRRQLLYSKQGVLLDSEGGGHSQSVHAWDANLSRLYAFNGRYLNYYNVVDDTGEITVGNGYWDSSSNVSGRPSIAVSPYTSQVLLNNGYIYEKSLENPLSLGREHIEGVWLEDKLALLLAKGYDTALEIRSGSELSVEATLTIQGRPIALFDRVDGDVNVITLGDDNFDYRIVELADSDSDGIPGWWEVAYGLDDNNVDDAYLDLDQDGLTNQREYLIGTNPAEADSDGDGLDDQHEVDRSATDPNVEDTDGDGLNDGDEVNQYLTNPLLVDSDGDSVSDGDEVNRYASNPLTSDSDGDTLDDGWEVLNGFNPASASDALSDIDADGLSNLQEYAEGTDPREADSDGDSLSDGYEVNTSFSDPTKRDTDDDKMPDDWEILYGFNPITASAEDADYDGDGAANFVEYFSETDPGNADSVPRAMAWNGYQGGNRHNGFVPLKLDPDNFSLRWELELLSYSNQVSTNGNDIFASNSGSISNSWIANFDAYDGATNWRKIYNDGSRTKDQISYYDGYLYFLGGRYNDAFLRKLDATTGGLIFRSSTNLSRFGYRAVAVDEERVYVPGINSSGLSAVDKDTGNTVWRQESTDNPTEAWTFAVDEEHLYFASMNSGLVIVDKDNGDIVGNIQVSPAFSRYSASLTPVIGRSGKVFVATEGRLLAFDVEEKNLAWSKSGADYSNLAVGMGAVYVIKDGVIEVLDENTGTILWSWESASSAPLSSNMVVTQNILFVGSNTQTYAIDLEQREVAWTANVGGSLSLGESGALLIASANDATLSAFNVGGDSDGDGMDDWWEETFGLNPRLASDAAGDNDSDGLSNVEEFIAGSRPLDADTDADGLGDALEVKTHGSNPAAADSDGDRLPDYDEIVVYKTDVLRADSDSDGINDFSETQVFETDPLDVLSVPSPVSSVSEMFNLPRLSQYWLAADDGSEPWSLGFEDGQENSYVLKSDAVANSEVSAIQYQNVFVEGRFSFEYRIGLSGCCGRLELYIDGERYSRLSGTSTWREQAFQLDAGFHVIEWRVTNSNSTKLDVWLDNIKFTSNE